VGVMKYGLEGYISRRFSHVFLVIALLFFTAKNNAFLLPISTTNFFPRVMPV
jgi:hypothetical protein